LKKYDENNMVVGYINEHVFRYFQNTYLDENKDVIGFFRVPFQIPNYYYLSSFLPLLRKVYDPGSLEFL
jgi:hypothetical protein